MTDKEFEEALRRGANHPIVAVAVFAAVLIVMAMGAPFFFP
ncbi:hypothetical protein [Pseudomonas sp. TCU-HL1]|nr:hypothetical protein [Pseudomonas sp. TCU-HL1]AOE85586.1 hypothetical protein THL1_3038 [Pseudomonas sp. TCU-HL1]AOE85600.1 hypothetical protein THL1_3052 [Pseudomonas sp. TCU-HL1]